MASVVLCFALLVLVACTRTVAGEVRTGSTSDDGRHSVVAFIGDSYTVGAFASDPAHRWTSLVAEHFGWVEQNFGVGGTGYAVPPTYYKRIAAVAALRPASVVVSGGFNDLYRGIVDPTFQQAANLTFAALREALPHARIIAIRPFFPAAPSPPPGVAVFAQDVRRAVVAAGGTYLDIGSPLSGQPNVMFADQIHPNDAGYQRLAEAVEKALSTHR